MSCSCDLSKINIYNLPDCPEVWALISSGNTKGVFQIESPGGRHWAKKLQPNNMDLLSALIAIIRPGVLNATQDDKSMTDLFCERRHGAESKSIDPNIDHILKPTYDILIYQEQMLEIAKHLCDFSLIELDKLRKGAGKKDAKLMNELRGLFVSKSKDKGLVTEDKANEIYDIIEASNRYAFNKCVSWNTIVKTKNGEKSISNLLAGEFVDSPEGWTQVLHIIDNGIKVLYEIELENGLKLECTKDHKLQTLDGLLPVGAILISSPKVYTTEGLFYIKKCTKVGFKPCCDIEVSNKSHLFYANGISTSNSHSFGYAYLTYMTAYLKHHFPLEFYASWIKNAQNEQDPQKELREMVQDARENGIEVLPPSALFKEPNTHINNGKIYLGLSDIKGVGEKAVAKLPDMSKMGWIDLLHNIKPKMLSCLIQSGALSHIQMSRKQMLAELNVWEQLTVKERQHIKSNLVLELTNGAKTKKLGGICHTEDRVFTIKSLVKTLTNSAYSTKDDPVVISRFETELLGINLTCAKSDYINKNMASCNLEDIRQGTKNGTLIAELKDVRIFKAKTGKTKGRFMAHVILEDETGELPGVVFADQYEIYESLLIRGNMVMAKVFSKDFKSVFINELWQA